MLVLTLFCGLQTYAQYTFELHVDNGMQVGNTDNYSVSGTVISGRIEKGKTYFLEDGAEIVIINIISSKTATTVPVANSPENVSLSMRCKNFRPTHGDVMKAISTRPSYGGGTTKIRANTLPEGVLTCRINGRIYRAKAVSKPVHVRSSNMLDLFFIAEDESVIWLQINGFSDIETLPLTTTSDTSQKEMMLICKLAYMPKGYRPTDMPTSYKAYEDFKGNSGIVVTSLNRYKKTLSLEFSGTLRPNAKLLEDQPSAGLFYITEGRVDNIGWDSF
ncbi:MAG: hypothetical protein IPI46_03265 [Bacteroidetes bacterium]|nr:hypothetical protein [Bacteroidota bacterium]